MAYDDNSLSAHKLKTPQAILDVAKAMKSGKPLPIQSTADIGVYTPRESIWRRLVNRIRPKKSCGCKARKERWNAIIPGLGTFVELLTTYTGIKWIVEKWYRPNGPAANRA